MKNRLFTLVMISLLTFTLYGGDLDGLWQSSDQNRNIEIMYTSNGIKARSAGAYSNNWIQYDRLDNNRYRDSRGNCLSLRGSLLEWCTADRRQVVTYSRLNTSEPRYGNSGAHGNGNLPYPNTQDPDRDTHRTDDRYDRNDRDGRWSDRGYGQHEWNSRDRASWNNYYQAYEGKWHNHTTGQRIQVDLTRRSLRIKFKGESWFEVFERNRGLFVDQRGNEFIFNGDNITYHSFDGDLSMKFYNDDRCGHHGDFRSEYWR